jgi:hypothetical protein
MTAMSCYFKRKFQMKKIALATILAIAATSSFAASLNLQYQNQEGKDGTANSNAYVITVRENITKNFAADVQATTVSKESTGGLSSQRLEVGGTGTVALAPSLPFSLYTRVATGQKFTSTDNFGYYSVEPGVTAPIGRTGLSARLGWRYRTAYDTANADETRTWRAGLNYQINKNDSVGVRYDSVRGDTNQNTVAVGYTRSF